MCNEQSLGNVVDGKKEQTCSYFGEAVSKEQSLTQISRTVAERIIERRDIRVLKQCAGGDR